MGLPTSNHIKSMIYIKYNGRLGNRLFQMSAAAFLSKKLKQKIINPIKHIIDFENNEPLFDYSENLIVNDHNILDIYSHKDIKKNLILDDFFQDHSIVQKFIEHNRYKKNEKLISDSTFMHIRLGDIKNLFSLDYSYYRLCLDKIGSDKLIISSDSPEDTMIKKLCEEFNGKVLQLDPVETIMFSASCKRKILSHGTFSWWIGFLGNIFYADQGLTTICPSENRMPKKWHGNIFPMFDWVVV